jgi:hypothetical protein
MLLKYSEQQFIFVILFLSDGPAMELPYVRTVMWPINDELEINWKEVVVVLCQGDS